LLEDVSLPLMRVSPLEDSDITSVHIILVSISSTLNVRVFCINVISTAFSSYMYVEKAAETTYIQKRQRKMLMKLTPVGGWHY